MKNVIAERQSKNTAYIMFGGIPSLLHIHNINVKDRPELHLHKPDRICNNTLMLQKKMVTHENDIEYQNNIRGGKKKESWYVSPHSGSGCIHEMMVSGCVGVSGLFVKHYNAVKLAFNQSSPPSRGAGLLQPSTDRRTAVQIQMHWAVPLQLAGHTTLDPLKKRSQDCATGFFFFSLTCNINPNS